MVDRKYSLPTLDKSDHRNITYCVRAWGRGQRGGRERERERERGREGGRERERERGGRGGVKYQSTSEVLIATFNCKYIYARDFQL